MADEKNIQELLEQTGRAILYAARNELYLRMRFMDAALCSFYYYMDTGTETIGTDGNIIYYNPAWLGGMYREEPTAVNRVYLHMVLHCILRHHIRRENREECLWDLSCEIAVESIIDGWDLRNVKWGQSFIRREAYRKLSLVLKVLSAEGIYHSLKEQNLKVYEMGSLLREFSADDHQYWERDSDRKSQMEQNQKWQDMSEQMETDMQTFSKEASDGSGNLLKQIRVENRERYDYRSFLRKFSVLKEEISVDEDSFDYTFYSYGLSLYGNMPLIEPQEWTEVQKVEEFVIVIDTSMSCSGKLVKKFLEETYGILSEQESFFRKVNIRILQCDEKVQSDKHITDAEELKEYMESLELRGEGGTDFRPAFAYVDRLISEKQFERLRGLIYFTDGYGVYPNRKPAYDTAFVFVEEDFEDVNVPPWAMKIIIDQEEPEGEQHGY